MNQLTVDQLSVLIKNEYESDEPDQIAEIIKHSFDKKRINKRLLDKLPGGRSRWYFRSFAGMSFIENIEYGKTPHNKNGMSLQIPFSKDTSGYSIVSYSDFETKNPAYFAGRKERNLARTNLLNDKNKLNAICLYYNNLIPMITAYKEFFEFGSDQHVVVYQLNSLIKEMTGIEF